MDRRDVACNVFRRAPCGEIIGRQGQIMTLYQDKYRIEPARYRGWDYRLRGWYFVTICTQQKARSLGEVVRGSVRLSQLGLIADSELRALSSHYKNVEVDSYLVMPNHVHAILMIEGEHAFSPNPKGLPQPMRISPAASSLSAIVRSYKAGVTRRSRELGFRENNLAASVLRQDSPKRRDHSRSPAIHPR